IPIPQSIAALLPILVTMLSSYLTHARLPPWLNALIAALAILLTSVACIWLSGNFTGNIEASVGLVLSYVAFFMRNDFAVLVQYLQAAASPVQKALPPTMLVPPRASRVSSAAQAPMAASQWQRQTPTQQGPPMGGDLP